LIGKQIVLNFRNLPHLTIVYSAQKIIKKKFVSQKATIT
jgi:hypothetical protein